MVTSIPHMRMGAKAPEFLPVEYTRQNDPDAAFPLPPTFQTSDVVSAKLIVYFRYPVDPVEWSCEIVARTAEKLILRHVFASDGSDLPRSIAPYSVMIEVILTLFDGTIRRSNTVTRTVGV